MESTPEEDFLSALPRHRNPHFDDNLVVWQDEYSGRYAPPPREYAEQFELQWSLALQRTPGFEANPGANTGEEYIKDRVYAWTGNRPGSNNAFFDESAGVRALAKPIPVALIKGKKCIDLACGMGRWTRAMQMIGAESVVSVDLSQSALDNVSRFNKAVIRADLMTLPDEHPELVDRFDFTNLWGIVMCTHDPCKAFLNAAATVKRGGALFLMVYAPEGIHNTALVHLQRKHFRTLKSVEDRLAYAKHVASRAWDPAYSLADNLRNTAVRCYHRLQGKKLDWLGSLDMLSPYYNWVIPLDVIDGWSQKAGFRSYEVLNKRQNRVAYHVLFRK